MADTNIGRIPWRTGHTVRQPVDENARQLNNKWKNRSSSLCAKIFFASGINRIAAINAKYKRVVDEKIGMILNGLRCNKEGAAIKGKLPNDFRKSSITGILAKRLFIVGSATGIFRRIDDDWRGLSLNVDKMSINLLKYSPDGTKFVLASAVEYSLRTAPLWGLEVKTKGGIIREIESIQASIHPISESMKPRILYPCAVCAASYYVHFNFCPTSYYQG